MGIEMGMGMRMRMGMRIGMGTGERRRHHPLPAGEVGGHASETPVSMKMMMMMIFLCKEPRSCKRNKMQNLVVPTYGVAVEVLAGDHVYL